MGYNALLYMDAVTTCLHEVRADITHSASVHDVAELIPLLLRWLFVSGCPTARLRPGRLTATADVNEVTPMLETGWLAMFHCAL